jgi:hypothetical protein
MVSTPQLCVTPTLDDYATAASLLWGEAGRYAVAAFARLNHELFNDELPPLPIVLGITAYGHCIGLTRGDGGHVADVPRISLAVGLFNKQGVRAVDDTLTHEMVHALLIRRGQSPDHNKAPWCKMITELSPKVLGHDITARPVRPRRVPNPEREHDEKAPKTKVERVVEPGALTRKQLAAWPTRPTGFDWGPTIHVPTY